jgi:hypothetical protein
MNHPRCLTVAISAALLAMTAGAGPISAVDSKPFKASFEGKFTILFGPNGTSDLQFEGPGHATHLGQSTVKGHAHLVPTGSPREHPTWQCSRIVDDHTTITSKKGELSLQNQATDCVETTQDGRTLIHGNGTYTITGGTGDVTGAAGTGAVSTEAIVTGGVPGGVTGTFDPLTFQGTISEPE